MTYILKDADKKELGTLTVGAWSAIKAAAVKKNSAAFPALAQLADHGYTNMLIKLKSECSSLAKSDRNLKVATNALSLAATQADEIVCMVVN